MTSQTHAFDESHSTERTTQNLSNPVGDFQKKQCLSFQELKLPECMCTANVDIQFCQIIPCQCSSDINLDYNESC